MAEAGPGIVVAGAGSIGCHVGGNLALAGRDLTLLLRPRLAEAIAAQGLHLTDLDGGDRSLAPGSIGLATDPAPALAGAEIVLVTVKSGDTQAMAGLIARHAPPGATVVSLQNGVDNVPLLRERLPGHTVVAGMVPFNIAQSHSTGQAPRFHRSTSGTLMVEAGHERLRAILDVPGMPCRDHPDMEALAWSKLALNMNNALNALSGLPLKEQLSRRAWRLVLASQIGEVLAVTRRAGIGLPRIEGIGPRAIPWILRLPDGLFGLVARRMLAIDPEATSSMAEDLAAGRRTEVGWLQGAVVRLAARSGTTAPACEAVIAMVGECERSRRRFTAEEVSARIAAARQAS